MNHFAVASDETNTIQIYEGGKPDPLGAGFDFEELTGADKSDIEGAAVIGSRIYWISSHSFNSSGEDKPKRKRLFTTDIVAGSPPSLKGSTSFDGLRDPLATATGFEKRDINIEGLAATTDGTLLIGFRSPLKDNMAAILPFRNPAATVEGASEPDFGPLISLDLNGMGIRSLERIDANPTYYLVVAGPVSDAAGTRAVSLAGTRCLRGPRSRHRNYRSCVPKERSDSLMAPSRSSAMTAATPAATRTHPARSDVSEASLWLPDARRPLCPPTSG